MKVLVIPGLRIEVDALGQDANAEAAALLEVINKEIAGLNGNPCMYRVVLRGSADSEDALYEDRDEETLGVDWE